MAGYPGTPWREAAPEMNAMCAPGSHTGASKAVPAPTPAGMAGDQNSLLGRSGGHSHIDTEVPRGLDGHLNTDSQTFHARYFQRAWVLTVTHGQVWRSAPGHHVYAQTGFRSWGISDCGSGSSLAPAKFPETSSTKPERPTYRQTPRRPESRQSSART